MFCPAVGACVWGVLVSADQFSSSRVSSASVCMACTYVCACAGRAVAMRSYSMWRYKEEVKLEEKKEALYAAARYRKQQDAAWKSTKAE